eukprot:c8888_g1_i1.p1 GENE.c8888_g1_i1~~c8888_g1_i1.p1  ORF type:complete len:805 (+),score=223.71 c8888_g1_i1:38-2416(+)
MRLSVFLCIFLALDGSFASIHEAQVDGAVARTTPRANLDGKLQLSNLLQLQEIPIEYHGPFIVIFFPLMLLLATVMIADKLPGTSENSDAIISVLRRGAEKVMFKRNGPLAGKTIVPVTIAIILVMFVSALMITAAAMWGFKLPIVMWNGLNGISKVMVAWVHFSLLASITGALLFMLPYLYNYLVRLRQFRPRNPNSSIDVDEAFKIISEFKDVDDLLENLPPIPAQVRKQVTLMHSFLARVLKSRDAQIRERMVNTTFETWKDADDSHAPSVDPLRIFIEFFHPQSMIPRAQLQRLRDSLSNLTTVEIETDTKERTKKIPLLSPEEMLKKAYEYHLTFDVAHKGKAAVAIPARLLRRSRSQRAISMIERPEDLKEIQVARVEQARLELEKLKEDLAPHLEVVWNAMKIESEFREIDAEDPLAEAMSACPDWGSFVVAGMLVLAQLMEYVGLGPDCTNLMTDDNKIIQNLPWYYKKIRTAFDYPTIPNGDMWYCTANICYLQCSRGYQMINGVSECDNKGGAGVTWTHLAADDVHVAACCLMSEDAEALYNFTVSATDISFGMNQTFSIGCGDDQSLKLHVCKDTSTALWQRRANCESACAVDTSGAVFDSTLCAQIDVDGVFPSNWTRIIGAESIEPEDALQLAVSYAAGQPFTLTPAPTLVSGNFIRLVYNRPLLRVKGPWMKWTTPTTSVSVIQTPPTPRAASLVVKEESKGFQKISLPSAIATGEAVEQQPLNLEMSSPSIPPTDATAVKTVDQPQNLESSLPPQTADVSDTKSTVQSIPEKSVETH